MIMDYTIMPARKEHAAAIARAVLTALGPEVPVEMAGGEENLPEVTALFTDLAARDDSQYSYLNSLVALDGKGEVAGALVSYDGARLHELRCAFIAAAALYLGWDPGMELPDETSADEIYLDSLAVFPPHRGQGLAARLIEGAARHHASSGKPLGLLCDPHNPRAKRLYERLGFRDVDRRFFMNEDMYHMRRP